MKMFNEKRQESAKSKEFSEIVKIVSGITIGLLIFALSAISDVLKTHSKGGRQ